MLVLQRSGKFFVCCKTVYQWITTNCCFMNYILKEFETPYSFGINEVQKTRDITCSQNGHIQNCACCYETSTSMKKELRTNIKDTAGLLIPEQTVTPKSHTINITIQYRKQLRSQLHINFAYIFSFVQPDVGLSRQIMLR